jgi:hypothetical protein
MARHLAHALTGLQEGNGHAAPDFELLFGALGLIETLSAKYTWAFSNIKGQRAR